MGNSKYKEISSVQIERKASLPIAAQISQHIAWLMASGRLNHNEKLPPVRQLASELGVSMHTIRAAYQDLEEQELVTMRQGSGSYVKGYGKTGKRNQKSKIKTNSIGVLIPGLNLFFLPLLEGIEQAAGIQQTMLFIGHTHDDGNQARRYLHQFAAKNVDGAIIVASWENYSEPRDFPVVTVDVPSAAGPSVLIDSEGAGFEAVSHLIAHGHTRLGLITCPIEWPNVNEVYRGCIRALESHQLSIRENDVVVAPSFSVEAGYQAAKRLFSQPDPPKAVFAISDQQAIGAMRAIQEMGLKIPADVAIVGYNDIEISAFIDPPLTTVSAPAFQMGYEAMELLSRQVAGDLEAKYSANLDTHLVIRKSCGC